MKTEKITFKFNVKSQGRWSAWTGIFQDELTARTWFENHGQFHLDNNHTLGMFKMITISEKTKSGKISKKTKTQLIEIFEPKFKSHV